MNIPTGYQTNETKIPEIEITSWNFWDPAKDLLFNISYITEQRTTHTNLLRVHHHITNHHNLHNNTIMFEGHIYYNL
jgi:hypothetical protein